MKGVMIVIFIFFMCIACQNSEITITNKLERNSSTNEYPTVTIESNEAVINEFGLNQLKFNNTPFSGEFTRGSDYKIRDVKPGTYEVDFSSLQVYVKAYRSNYGSYYFWAFWPIYTNVSPSAYGWTKQYIEVKTTSIFEPNTKKYAILYKNNKIVIEIE